MFDFLHRPLRRRILMLALSSAIIATASTATQLGAKADDAVIVYGGVAHLSNEAQPIFATLFTGGNEPGASLRRKLETSLRKTVSSIAFPWSAAPVVIDVDDANAVMRQRVAGWDKVRPTILQLGEAFDTVYALAVVIDLELDVKSPPHVEGASYANLIGSSATALLVDMDTKRIVLSASDVRSTTLVTDDGFLPRAKVTSIMAATYMNAASAAVQKLADRMRGTSPSDPFDWHMVTGAIFPGGKAQKLFDMRPWSGSVKSVCELPRQCDGAGSCAALNSLATSVATAALIDAGQAALPPYSWVYWASRSQNLIALNLVQPRGGIMEDVLRFRLDPVEADIKAIAEVHLSEPNIVRSQNANANSAVWTGTRFDHALVKMHRYTTDAYDCALDAKHQGVIAGQGVHESRVTAGYTEPDAAIRRFYAVGALLDAKGKLSKEVESHAN